MTNLYLKLKNLSEQMMPGFEAVFYNAHRDITYQNYLVMSAVGVGDTPAVIDKKIRML